MICFFISPPLVGADEAPATRPAPVRIACVGDSITFGSGLKDRHHDSYPSQLGRMLGDGFEVQNFGVSGATLLKKGDRPYWNQRRFTAAKAFNPDLVIIMLGTNDSKPQNWSHKADFASDLAALVKTFRDLPSHPRVDLCRPVPAFPGKYGIRDQVIHNEIIPIIDQVAREQHCKVIDLYAALTGHGDLFPDTVHPNAEGAKLMAKAVENAIKPVAAAETKRKG
jgi:lysophospholipase L1-like esterase